MFLQISDSSMNLLSGNDRFSSNLAETDSSHLSAPRHVTVPERHCLLHPLVQGEPSLPQVSPVSAGRRAGGGGGCRGQCARDSASSGGG